MLLAPDFLPFSLIFRCSLALPRFPFYLPPPPAKPKRAFPAAPYLVKGREGHPKVRQGRGDKRHLGEPAGGEGRKGGRWREVGHTALGGGAGPRWRNGFVFFYDRLCKHVRGRAGSQAHASENTRVPLDYPLDYLVKFEEIVAYTHTNPGDKSPAPPDWLSRSRGRLTLFS